MAERNGTIFKNCPSGERCIQMPHSAYFQQMFKHKAKSHLHQRGHGATAAVKNPQDTS